MTSEPTPSNARILVLTDSAEGVDSSGYLTRDADLDLLDQLEDEVGYGGIEIEFVPRGRVGAPKHSCAWAYAPREHTPLPEASKTLAAAVERIYGVSL